MSPFKWLDLYICNHLNDYCCPDLYAIPITYTSQAFIWAVVRAFHCRSLGYVFKSGLKLCLWDVCLRNITGELPLWLSRMPD